MPHLPQRFPLATLAPIVFVAITLTLSGCGRRGSLEAPPGSPGASASSQDSKARLTPGIAGGASRTNPADRDPLSQASRTGDLEEEEAPIPAPKRPFILDAIL